MVEPGQSPVEILDDFGLGWGYSDLNYTQNYQELQQNYV